MKRKVYIFWNGDGSIGDVFGTLKKAHYSLIQKNLRIEKRYSKFKSMFTYVRGTYEILLNNYGDTAFLIEKEVE